jgi:ankyrin repeat protein
MLATLLPVLVLVATVFVWTFVLSPEALALRAAVKGDRTTLAALLQAGVSPDTRDRVGGATLLMHAVRMGHLQTVLYLLDQGADVNARNHRGNTALFLAVEFRRVPIARELLLRRAKANLRNHAGQTALDRMRADQAFTLLVPLAERGPIR